MEESKKLPVATLRAVKVFLLATLDTKGPEAKYVRDKLMSEGVEVALVDTGCLGNAKVKADIPREEVFQAAGVTLEEMQKQGERGVAVNAAARGATALVESSYREGELMGVLGLGGSAGTVISTAAMRALPLGVPKLMISTLASGNVRPFVGNRDICFANPVADILGLNRISRITLGNAAAAMAGMVKAAPEESRADSRPQIAATMFGVTTPCIEKAREILDEAGFDVVVFHATGNGGEAMEALIREGIFSGVLDVTTTELADEQIGGILSAGPNRLTAAAEMGVPQVVSVGAMDMVNFGSRDTVPPAFEERIFHVHNAEVTLMRTTVDENASLGEEIGRKVSAAKGLSEIHLPRMGVSAIDREGQPFEDEAARGALFDAVRSSAATVPVIEHDSHINDSAFAEAAAQALLSLIEKQK